MSILLLNADYRPLAIISQRRAASLLAGSKAESVPGSNDPQGHALGAQRFSVGFDDPFDLHRPRPIPRSVEAAVVKRWSL